MFALEVYVFEKRRPSKVNTTMEILDSKCTVWIEVPVPAALCRV